MASSDWGKTLKDIQCISAGKLTGQELEKHIESLLKLSGGVLPDDYKEFAQATGGYCRVRALLGFHAGEHDSFLQTFYGLGIGGAYDQMDAMESYKGRIPEGFIPVAMEQGGSLLLLQTSGPGFGRVYYWDHENEVPDNFPSFENMHMASETFLGFLENLKVDEDEDW